MLYYSELNGEPENRRANENGKEDSTEAVEGVGLVISIGKNFLAGGPQI